jgi:hypothetical protein
MKKLQAGLTAATLAAAFAATSIVPANAVPIFVPKIPTAQSDVIQVGSRYRRWYPAAGAFVAGALIGGALANSNRYYGGYYGGSYNNYYNDYYYPRPYAPRYYAPRYYQERVYYPPQGSAYRQGYRDGYRDGYYGSRYYNDITCTQRLQEAGKC